MLYGCKVQNLSFHWKKKLTFFIKNWRFCENLKYCSKVDFSTKKSNFWKFLNVWENGPKKGPFLKNLSIFYLPYLDEKGSLENFENSVEKVMGSTTRIQKVLVHMIHTVFWIVSKRVVSGILDKNLIHSDFLPICYAFKRVRSAVTLAGVESFALMSKNMLLTSGVNSKTLRALNA